MPQNLRTVVIWTRCLSLVLASLTAQAENPALDKLVDRTSRQVDSYLEQVSNVTCTERVSQLKLAPNGSVQASDEATYNYLILLQGTRDDLILSESRLPRSPEHKAPKHLSLLLSNGFSTLFLIFHPYYVSSYHFEPGGDEVIRGQTVARVHFTAIPGARTPAVLALRGREYPLELTGDAWIEPASGMVARIRATLAADMRDIGLRSLQVQAEYAPIRLPAWPREYLFPDTATIEVETLRQHWRNTHHFSEYMSFMVGTEQNIADQQLAEPDSAQKKPKKGKKK